MTDPAARARLFGQADHVRFHGRDLAERLEAAGFEVEVFHMLDELRLTPEDIRRMNLDKRELICRCTKR